MAAEADNAAAVDELLRAEAAAAAAGRAPVSDADAAAIAARHGLAPLLHAVDAGAGAGAPTPHWRPALRRYIRQRDAEWLYPLGAPEDVLAAHALAAAVDAERDHA
jgi:hypothetical protein